MQSPELLADYTAAVTLPVQWGDQDAFGHVNNTVFIRWFESSRAALLENVNAGEYLQAKGLGPILVSISCQYLKQVKYPDTIVAAAKVSEFRRSSFTIGHAIYSEHHRAIAAEGESVLVMFDYEVNRPRRIPDELRRKF